MLQCFDFLKRKKSCPLLPLLIVPRTRGLPIVIGAFGIILKTFGKFMDSDLNDNMDFSVLTYRWFGVITRKRIRHGVFISVSDVVTAIEEFIRINNENPKPFVWTKNVGVILEKIAYCKAVTVTAH